MNATRSIKAYIILPVNLLFGARDRIRTHNLGSRNPLHCPVMLHGLIWWVYCDSNTGITHYEYVPFDRYGIDP